MKRRIFLSGLLALPFATALHAEEAWSAELLAGSFDGQAYQAGLHIMLQPGWKTYWRNPGEGGIPPSIDLTGENLASSAIAAPLPSRIVDESGEAIGYHGEVVFLLKLTPQDPALPVSASLKSFFGVCAKICTPAKFSGELNFKPASAPSPQAQLLEQWAALVPRKKSFLETASVKDGELVLDLALPVDDIFIEGPDRFYFRKPDLARQHGKAFIKIDGLKTDQDLKSAQLRLTAAMQGKGIEQTIILA